MAIKSRGRSTSEANSMWPNQQAQSWYMTLAIRIKLAYGPTNRLKSQYMALPKNIKLAYEL